MKIKTLTRSKTASTRERSADLTKVYRTPAPELHPFERAREYTRAVNAAKLDRVFAKPFVGALSGHCDGVYCMAKNAARLGEMLSGDCAGELRLWRLGDRSTLFSAQAHEGFVRGLSFTAGGERFLSCGTDKLVKLWDVNALMARQEQLGRASERSSGAWAAEGAAEPLSVFMGGAGFNAVDHAWDSQTFATASSGLNVWDVERSRPISSFEWGVDSVHSVRYNPSQPNIVASTGSDRSVCIYDTRLRTAVRKLILQMSSNAVCWNPREAFNFTAANEDTNLYSFDMRKLDRATSVHMDHVGAVMDLDYSPTGEEFVSGGYDRTVRIWKRDGGRSREVYHTKRMQRIFSVEYSMDGRYVLSGSDDTNLRLWKSDASAANGLLLPREKQQLQYAEKLRDRYGHLEEVRRIVKHRHVPKVILKTRAKHQVMKQSRKVKEDHRREHSAPGSVPFVAARKQKVVKELE